MNTTGRLDMIMGPMFSGKTTELLRLYERKRRAGVNCLLVKYSGDTRYGTDTVYSHSMVGKGEGVPAISLSKLSSLFEPELEVTELDTVFIDEIQFFPDKDQILHLLTLNIDVCVSGLNGDYLRQPFLGMDKLYALAHTVHSLQAVCSFCHSEEACFTARLGDSKEQILVGGANLYRACCLKCHIKTASGL